MSYSSRDNDNDLVVNINDDCPEVVELVSSPSTDYDGDRCKDDHLEDDMTNGGYNDTEEITCASGPLNPRQHWI